MKAAAGTRSLTDIGDMRGLSLLTADTRAE
jgi:hypothetical protein